MWGYAYLVAFELSVKVKYIQRAEELPLILVQALCLDIENRVGRHRYTAAFADISRQPALVFKA